MYIIPESNMIEITALEAGRNIIAAADVVVDLEVLA